MPLGRFTGKNYQRMPKPTMMPVQIAGGFAPVQDITSLATGMPEQTPVVPMQALPPSPIDPAYEAWVRGEDSRGTYTPPAPDLLEPIDDSDVRAIQMDHGIL